MGTLEIKSCAYLEQDIVNDSIFWGAQLVELDSVELRAPSKSPGREGICEFLPRVYRVTSTDIQPFGQLSETQRQHHWVRADSSLPSSRCLCRFGGLDVVVHAEEVRRIVFVFQGDEAIVIAAVRFACDGVALIGYVVAVSSGD